MNVSLKKFQWLAAASLVAVVAGCASSPTIRSDFDPSADFSQYRTYDYFSPLGTDSEGYSTILTNTIKSAVDREMQARGYVKSSSSPTLLVNFGAKVQQKTDVNTVPAAPVGGYYGYRGGFYAPWGGWGNETYVDQYNEGTLNIDLVDPARKQLVWEGVAVGRVSDDTNSASVNAAVTQIFAKYPFTAGSATAQPQK
ncbi:DUF4136 domain-containing protein [Pseudoxanthomonas dokdonensis]|uniref:Lipoprotein n=1 Tax=Pseudoxanthomonas dokdonensis TaxID=344882 RepID=A0A0R0CQ49_9GAMM|nr:DUF4136 domain-containing protein [Pseudoxanthomonas dokdonensis]KRG71478.1 lipoprotein [Pseudoxanthomonas dokdonensis]